MTPTFWVIVIAGLIAAVWWWDEGDDDDIEPYKPCPEYGCPSAKGSDKSIPPRGNVVLNEFYYPYSGAQDFEHDSDGATMEPAGPAFVSGNVNTMGGVENMVSSPDNSANGRPDKYGWIDYDINVQDTLGRTQSRPDTNDTKLRGRTQSAHYALQTPLQTTNGQTLGTKSEPDHVAYC